MSFRKCEIKLTEITHLNCFCVGDLIPLGENMSEEVVTPTIHEQPISNSADHRHNQLRLSEFERFNQFLDKLRDSDEPIQKCQHNGVGDFLKYNLGHLKGSDFEMMSGPTNLYREIKDVTTNSTFYLLPHVVQRPCLLIESKLVNEKGKPVTISYKETDENTPTTESYPFPPWIFEKGHPDYFTISKRDLIKGFKTLRAEIKEKLIKPISKATGYKWEYSKSSYKDRVYFLEFNCFQDVKKDMNPSKFRNEDLSSIFEIQECLSSIHIGIQIFTKKFIISYHHKNHTKLVDIIYSILSQIYNES